MAYNSNKSVHSDNLYGVRLVVSLRLNFTTRQTPYKLRVTEALAEKGGLVSLVFTYRSRGMWNNSALFHLAVSSIIWLPLAFFGITVAVESKSLSAYILFPSMLLVLALFLLKRAKLKIHFPAVEVTEHHLILNMPMSSRAVYNLEDIEDPKFVLGSLYFRHLGWPVITSFASMPKEKQNGLVEALLQHS